MITLRKRDIEKQLDQKVMVLLGRNSDKIRYIRAMANFCVDHLGLRNSRFKIAIVPLKERKKRYRGVTDDYKNIIVILLMMDQSPYELAQTLAHEFIHVKQICRGTMKTVSTKGISWRGKTYLWKVPFMERPWELQALREQDILVHRFEEWSC